MRESIRKILLTHWDPGEVVNVPAAHTAYDALLPPLQEAIESGADREGIIAILQDFEHTTMCFPTRDARRLERVADKLLALRAGS